MAALAIALLILAFGATSPAKADPQADVIGGSSVTHSQYVNNYSFVVGLLPDTNPDHQFCGGTLIASRWVVTAAHCWAPEEGAVPKYIYIGSEDLFSDGQVVPVSGHYSFPDWSPDLVKNDIMLLKLAYAPSGNPAARATPAEDPAAGNLATILGWGVTSAGSGGSPAQILQRADIEVVNQSTCIADWYAFQTPISGGQICAIHYGGSGSDVPRQACSGDSGGPLLYGGKLVGIVSFGYANCLPQAPSVYTRVSAYNGWIDGVRSKALSVTGGNASFGAVDKDNQTASRTIQFRSDGDDPITISAATGSGDFSVKSSTCTGTLAPGSSCSIAVTFDPSAGGVRRGTLSLVTDSTGYPTFAVPLDGTGLGDLNLPVSLRIAQVFESKKAKRGSLTASFHVSFFAPKQLSIKEMCAGGAYLSLLMPTSKPVYKKLQFKFVGSGCSTDFSARVARSARHKKAKAIIRFDGNGLIAPASDTRAFRLR